MTVSKLKYMLYILSCCFQELACNGQELIYQTNNGSLTIVTGINDANVTFHSRELKIFLDYNTALFEVELDPSTLHTGIDSIDSIIKNLDKDLVILKGKIGLQKITTFDHPPLHFSFSGKLKYKLEVLEVFGEGHLEHYSNNDQPACRLGMAFELGPEDPIFNTIIYPLRGELKIQIIQTVLHQDH